MNAEAAIAPAVILTRMMSLRLIQMVEIARCFKSDRPCLLAFISLSEARKNNVDVYAYSGRHLGLILPGL